MSALVGQASKGEKQKQRFQSLDINKIYRTTRGESSEKTQQKNIVVYKHGMQILGRVPNARRPPANLPSLKSEHSGTEAAVPLVPPGGPGWGKQDSGSVPNGVSPTKVEAHTTPNSTSHTGIPHSQVAPPKQEHTHAPIAPVDKSWSAVMSRNDVHSHHPPPYQGPQFQHDFPSLSAIEAGQTARGQPGAQDHGPHSSSLSLRPQTEGSWIGGGTGSGGDAKPASGHLGGPPQLSAQAGLSPQQQTLPPQYRGVMPSFMYKNNPPSAYNASNSSVDQHLIPPFVNGHRQEKPIVSNTNSNRKGYNDIVPPSIIKEEELHRMDEMEKDMGWAYSDDIDYNKKLSFSDDEQAVTEVKPKSKQLSDYKNHEKSIDNFKKSNNEAWQVSNRGSHSSEEEEIKLKRTQHTKELDLVVQRAQQRKLEEEKRFNEATKRGANKKLKELEEKISKRDRDGDEGCGTINPSIIPPKPIAPKDIPLPDFQKEKSSGNNDHFKERDEQQQQHSRVPNETQDEKADSGKSSVTTFKQLTEIEGKTSFRRNGKNQERESREQAVNYLNRFQNDLPPRFKKQQNIHPQFMPPGSAVDYFEGRSHQQKYAKANGPRKISPGNHVYDHDSRRSEDSYSSQSSSDPIRKPSESSYTNGYDFDNSHHRNDDKIHLEKREDFDKDYDRIEYGEVKSRNEIVHSADVKPKNARNQDIYDRLQRLDIQESSSSSSSLSKISRDSSRYSNNIECHDYNSWSESKFDMAFDERRKENAREDRRQVPGPITRDRIEAEDDGSETRNLTALKRGSIPDKKIGGDSKLKTEKSNDHHSDMTKGSDSDLKNTEGVDKFKIGVKRDEKDKNLDNVKKPGKLDDYREDKRSNRNRIYPQNKVWNNEYHHRSGERGGGGSSAWQKKGLSSGGGGGKNGAGRSNSTIKSQTSDCFGSALSELEIGDAKDDLTQKSGRSQPKGNSGPKDEKRVARNDKDNKSNDKIVDGKKDGYVPRGEPTRHGRGGGNFRSRAGLSRRIDGYGPPSSKSPFTHHDDKKSPRDLDDEGKPHIGNMEKEDENKSSAKHADDKEAKNKSSKPPSKPSSVGGNLAKKNSAGGGPSINEKKSFGTKSSGDTSKQQTKIDELNANGDKANVGDVADEDVSIHADSDGFQEVKSKKATVKERTAKTDEKQPSPSFVGKLPKNESKDRDKIKKPPSPAQATVQQSTHNIPPLMGTLVNPPHVLPQPNKSQFDRNRQNKMPPRFAKLRDQNRIQKMQIHGGGVGDDVKTGGRNMFNGKMNAGPLGGANAPAIPASNAWDKPLNSQLRQIDADSILSSNLEQQGRMDHSHSPLQSDVGDNAAKKITKPPSGGSGSGLLEKAGLDGTSPPVNTIIFENTNLKSSVASNRNLRTNDKTRKDDSNALENQQMTNFSKPINSVDLLNKNSNDKQTDPIQLQLPFKEDGGDMKLDFFDSDLSSLSDDKSLKNSCLTRTIHHSIQTVSGNNMSTADALNFKIQSVKKVWETAAEHTVQQEDANASFSSSFVADPGSLDSAPFVKSNDTVDDNHEQHSYSPAANQQTTNNTTNVCKVKPTQQISGSNSQTVSNNNGAHPVHSGMMGGPGLMGNPLSPPPIQPVIGAGVGLGQPPQQYPTNQHIGYQTGLGGSSQYGMSTIPSPPTVLPYTAQPLQAQTNLYGAFQIDQGVLGGQGRSQFSQYPNHYGLGQAASSPYSAQSMFLQTAQAHPPPNAQGPPEIYPNINSFRLSNGPFGQNQQLSNPTTVLISSTSNSLMSASVKPSTQQISAIGTKSGGVGQAYQQQSQQGQQMYMFDPNIPPNYLQGAGVLQRPAAPVQSNVVQTIQQSSSYYSASTGTAKPPFNCTWRF